MEALAFYLFKSSVWLTGFAAVYFLFLRNERFFVLNRIFLVSGMAGSVVFPLLTWHYTVIFPVIPTANVSEPQVQAIVAADNSSFQARDLLLYIYISGITYLIYRLVWQTTSVWQIIRKSEILHFNSVKLVRTRQFPASFSFFSFVFVNPSTHEHEINEIVNHEQEHIRQRHWIDLLLFEIVCMVQWFNPVIWIYGRFIRQNHEFLADEQALRRTSNPAIYRAALLNQMFGGPVISLSNSFNYSINKKRFNMMKQITYSPFRKLKLLLVLPLMAGVFYAFATPEYKFIQANPEVQANQPQSQSDNNPQTAGATEGKTVKGRVTDEQGKPLKNASIIVSGTTIGTVSDASGSFELKMTNESPVIVSYVGYDFAKVQPDFSKEMEIKMKRVVISIDAIGNSVKDSEPKEKTNASQPSASVEHPLLVIDGVITEDKKPEEIDPGTIQSVNIWKDEKATAKYGEKGRNGVIEITTKSAFQNNQPLYVVDGKIMEQMPSADVLSSTNIASIAVLKGESAKTLYGEKGKNGVLLLTSKKHSQNSNAGTTIRNTQTGTPPLIVINGTISDKKVEDIDPETIQAINVLTREMATLKYGEKGKDGVLEVTLKKQGEVFTMVEQMPEFPGGLAALKEFVRANLQYPKAALEKGTEGMVYVNFMVSKTGAVSDVKVAKGVDPLLDKEAARIVALMPNWTPGKQHGDAVDVYYTVPIEFHLPIKK